MFNANFHKRPYKPGKIKSDKASAKNFQGFVYNILKIKINTESAHDYSFIERLYKDLTAAITIAMLTSSFIYPFSYK